MKWILVILAIPAFFAGCKKDSGEPPVISITTPADHQTFQGGQIVTINATIIDHDEVHHVHLYVRNKGTSGEILHVEEHPDTKTFSLSKTFTAQAGITYQIEIQADNHAGNTADVKIEVTGVN